MKYTERLEDLRNDLMFTNVEWIAEQDGVPVDDVVAAMHNLINCIQPLLTFRKKDQYEDS